MPLESEMPPEKNEWLCDPFDQTPVELGHDSSNEFDRMWIWWRCPWWSRLSKELIKYFGKSIRIHEDRANVIEWRIKRIGSSFCWKQGFQVWKGRTWYLPGSTQHESNTCYKPRLWRMTSQTRVHTIMPFNFWPEISEKVLRWLSPLTKIFLWSSCNCK